MSASSFQHGVCFDGRDERLLCAIQRLTAVTENLANAVAALRRSEAHGETMTATLLDANDLAKILGADVRTVRRWVREGEAPPPIRIGGTLRWRKADVERWLEEKR